MSLLDVLGAVCRTERPATSSSSPSSSPHSSTQPSAPAPCPSSSTHECPTTRRCGVDTVALDDRCIGILPYNWTRVQDVDVVGGAPIQEHRDQLSVSQCLHQCERENGTDPPRHVVRRCDRVVFDETTKTCRLYDSLYGNTTTRRAPGVNVYMRGDSA